MKQKVHNYSFEFMVDGQIGLATDKLIEQATKRRYEIISERLKELTGIDINVEEESKRRFKRLQIEYIGDKEHVYFNDGSDNGLRVVTFINRQQPINIHDMKTEIKIEFDYY